MKGIDISEHNGYVDFEKVKKDGIDFVIIRLGWIGNKQNHTLDKYFESYYKKAKENNLKIGLYVYSYCKSISAIKDGTNWCLKVLKENNIKNIDMPFFIDLEDETIKDCGKDELTAHAVTFGNIVENNGYKAGIYANLYWFNTYLNVNKLITFKIWLAQYTNLENHSANFKVDLWQYSSNGVVTGINTRVDMNKCLNCQNLPEITEENKGEFEMKIYQNGSTKENVYQDVNCTKNIGYLFPHETAECYGVVNDKAVVVYNTTDGNKKVGFVKWLGGVK